MDHQLYATLRALSGELHRDDGAPGTIALPATLHEVITLVDAQPGVRFGELVRALSPDLDAADQALRALLVDAANPPAPPPADLDRWLTKWDPVITAIAAAATAGDALAELRGTLDQAGATSDWGALVAVWHRILDGERDREPLVAGLDQIDTAIVNATLDRIAEQKP